MNLYFCQHHLQWSNLFEPCHSCLKPRLSIVGNFPHVTSFWKQKDQTQRHENGTNWNDRHFILFAETRKLEASCDKMQRRTSSIGGGGANWGRGPWGCVVVLGGWLGLGVCNTFSTQTKTKKMFRTKLRRPRQNRNNLLIVFFSFCSINHFAQHIFFYFFCFIFLIFFFLWYLLLTFSCSFPKLFFLLPRSERGRGKVFLKKKKLKKIKRHREKGAYSQPFPQNKILSGYSFNNWFCFFVFLIGRRKRIISLKKIPKRNFLFFFFFFL